MHIKAWNNRYQDLRVPHHNSLIVALVLPQVECSNQPRGTFTGYHSRLRYAQRNPRSFSDLVAITQLSRIKHNSAFFYIYQGHPRHFTV